MKTTLLIALIVALAATVSFPEVRQWKANETTVIKDTVFAGAQDTNLIEKPQWARGYMLFFQPYNCGGADDSSTVMQRALAQKSDSAKVAGTAFTASTATGANLDYTSNSMYSTTSQVSAIGKVLETMTDCGTTDSMGYVETIIWLP